MDNLSIRKVQHPQAPNNYRVILKTEHDGELEIGSIGVKAITSRDTAWVWGIDTVLPMRDHESEGRGTDRKDCMDRFRDAWEQCCRKPGWLDEFLAVKRTSRRLP
jgi:hypothetical protein